MFTSTHLLRRRRFLPLFVTQLFNAFNDNLYKTTMVLFVVYAVYNDESTEATFSGLASGLFILPFFLLSALAGIAVTFISMDFALKIWERPLIAMAPMAIIFLQYF